MQAQVLAPVWGLWGLVQALIQALELAQIQALVQALDQALKLAMALKVKICKIFVTLNSYPINVFSRSEGEINM